MKKTTNISLLFLFLTVLLFGQENKYDSQIKIGRVKYGGGGDWYNDPSAEKNLLMFAKNNAGIDTAPGFEAVELSSDKIFSYPILFITGHGNINILDSEVRKLRAYLENGGFLYVDDDYGMDQSFRREMKKVFPDIDFVELKNEHGLYKAFYDFPKGVPKINEHDGKAPKGFGIFIEKRLIVLYTYESNPSDGWVDKEVHNIPEDKREQALRFGTNILVWCLTH
ncbi:MAG: DUF4159 domain-containing protein [Bacteroidetes bacterium]|nr:DUF4159 domain-containing protein [Bacteroidota bacterium]